ncbi:MAG TPA: cysteine--tRNA ligase [Candidatus Paceibacterota bacterium]|nr:cysteine--tRNA ligase [Candidatus Paceibacterota bacterium]
MTVRLYNSLSRTIEEFTPRQDGHVQMFVCGPTVYDFIHLGNARTFTVFDVVARWLRYRGFDVTYIQNITDIDDRIIVRSAEHGQESTAYARAFDDAFRDDMRSLGNDAVSRYARASDHIPEVIAQVKRLIETGHVYRIDGDGWYFDLKTFPDYGKLSGRTAAEAEDAVSRIDDSSRKRNVGDFCVWKSSKPGEPQWDDAQLGAGRPGWHIEDTAITEKYFGPQYDLHGGGMDLKFPHHEAEIAQQESASGKVPFVRYWMHAGFLENAAGKMSKSKGNITPLRTALQTYSPAAVRFFFLSNHYRAPLQMTDASLDAAEAATQRIAELAARSTAFQSSGKEDSPILLTIRESHRAFEEAMDDDFNTPVALAAVFSLVTEANKAITDMHFGIESQAALREFFTLVSEQLGIVPPTAEALPDDIRGLTDKRERARSEKDWAGADAIRDQLSALGYSVDDTPYGPLVKRK